MLQFALTRSCTHIHANTEMVRGTIVCSGKKGLHEQECYVTGITWVHTGDCAIVSDQTNTAAYSNTKTIDSARYTCTHVHTHTDQ